MRSVAWSSGISLAAQPISASRARGFVRQRLVDHGLLNLCDDVELVASELVTNALVHAQTSFNVSLEVVEERLRLAVEDGSRDRPCRVAARALDVGGRGIAIVDLLSRDWGVRAHTDDGGKSVWAEFDL